MKKIIIGIVIVVVIAVTSLLAIKFLYGENSWVCVNNKWVKHGQPSDPQPTESCGNKIDDNQNNIQIEEPFSSQKNVPIYLDNLKPEQEISSPFTLTGKVAGTWYFEASFPVKIVDQNDNIIGEGIAQAHSDWMTEELVPFSATLDFTPTTNGNGFIILKKDNPSDLPANDDELKIPIKFTISAETMKVKVYFNNNNMDPEISCNKVFSVEREVPKTTATARAALTELLKGVMVNEEKDGFYSSINYDVKIQKLTIQDGVAKVDFDKQIEDKVGGSCRVSAIRSQITETLKQFSTVQQVIISVDGQVDEALQP